MEELNACYDLEKLHRALLVITDEIDRICKKNSIHYSLIAGSMLGAIRHKGFIPWDDDMDIGMNYKDYELFLEACKQDLNNEMFEVQNVDTDRYFPYCFTKLLLKGTSLVECGHESTKYKKSIFVDIFPFNNIPENHTLMTVQSLEIYVLKKMIMLKEVKPRTETRHKKIIAWLLYLIARLFKKDYLVKTINSIQIKYERSCHIYKTNMFGYYGYKKEIIPAYCFDTFVRVQFEDRQYDIMSNYDLILRNLYGEYMKLPPLEQQRTHEFRNLDFGSHSFVGHKVTEENE